LARKVDAEADAASKAILDQLQTKTVGAPPSSTGLTGDQLPETIFDVADFDLVKNQVTLQLSNLELLNVLNTIGQVTNTQSQSGPIPGTSEVVTITYDANQYYTIFTPKPGEVYQVQAMFVFTATGFSSGNISILDNVNSTRCHIADVSSSGGDVFDQGFESPIYIDENVSLQFFPNGTLSDSATVNTYLIRVR